MSLLFREPTTLRTLRIMWLLSSILALSVALIGLLYPSIYTGLIEETIIAGVISQDLIVALVAVIAIFLILSDQISHYKIQIVMTGIMGFYTYAYGIYTIERVYNILYLAYLGIFSLSIFSIIYAIIAIDPDFAEKIHIDHPVEKASLIYMVINPIIFYPLWLSQLIPLLINREQIDSLYSIYIIDLGFIMPLFLLLAYHSYRDKGYAKLFTPALFIVGIAILLPLSIAELINIIIFEIPMDTGSFFMFTILSTLFGFLSYYQLKYIRFNE